MFRLRQTRESRVSGFVGIVHLGNAPVDRDLIHQLTDFQAFRGPDAQQVWVNGGTAFGHTLLRSTQESQNEHQPLTLDGATWIVADARVDARPDLIAKLRALGQEDLAADTPDVELILRSYHAWGEDCVGHLIGDFAFGIWDGPRKRLFCARDQMGVKTFLYYAHLGSLIVFANTLDCIRLHPRRSRDRLNDQAIADFLLFESNQDSATTSFADIQRLPPAHRAAWSQEGFCLTRYWILPVEDPLLLKHADDYFNRFKELLHQVVGDRLRTYPVGIFLSGGLDSTTLLAEATNFRKQSQNNSDLLAITKVDGAIPDEADYAKSVANQLQVPVHFVNWGDETVNPWWEQTPWHTQEPNSSPWNAVAYGNYWRQIEPYSRVFLYGEGPDNALRFEWRLYAGYLMRHRRYLRLFQDSCSTLLSQRRLPFWGHISDGVTQIISTRSSRPLCIPCLAESGSRKALRSAQPVAEFMAGSTDSGAHAASFSTRILCFVL